MSRSGPEPHLKLQLFGRQWHMAECHIHELRTMSRVKYVSSDYIAIWYIRTISSFRCSFTSCSPICYPINLSSVAVKWWWQLGVFHSDSLNINRIANWTTGGAKASKTVSFAYISYCDTIRTQILNWSQSSQISKQYNWSKNCALSGVRIFAVEISSATVLIPFQPRSGTELRISNCCQH